MTDSPVVGSASFELRASLDRLRADTQQGEREVQESVDRIERKSVIGLKTDFGPATSAVQASERQITTSLGRIAQANGQVSTATNLTRVQVLELTHVAKSLFDEVAAGSSPLRALAVESGRIGEVAAQSSGGLLGLGRTLAGMLAPFAAVAAAVAGVAAVVGGATLAFVGFEASQKRVSETLNGLGRASGASADQIDEVAGRLAANGQLSLEAARQLQESLLKTGEVGAQALAPAAEAVLAYARATGETAQEAEKALGPLFKDPAAGAAELNEKLGFLDQKTLGYIRTLQEQGNQQQALAVASTALQSALSADADKVNVLAQAWNNVKHYADQAWEAIGRVIDRAVKGPSTREQIGRLEAQLANGDALGTDKTAVQAKLKPLYDKLFEGLDRDLSTFKNQRGQQAADRLASADPKVAERSRLANQRAGIDDDVRFGVTTSADAARAKAAIDKQIADLDKGPRGRKPRTPADTTVGSDVRADAELDAADKDLAGAKKEAAAALRQTSTANTIAGKQQLAIDNANATDEAAHGAIQADLDSKLDKLADDELKVRTSKNDKHKAEEQEIIATAREREIEAAELRRETADRVAQAAREKAAREAAIAALQEQAAADQAQMRTQLELAQLDAAFAVTTKERLTAQLNILALEKAQADAAIKNKADVAAAGVDLSSPDVGTALSKILSDRTTAQSQSDAVFGARAVAIGRQNLTPWAKWKQDGIDAAKGVGDALESEAVKAMDDFNNGLADAIVNGKSMGDALSSIFKTLEADLIRYLAKQAEIGIFGGAGGGGGLFGSLLGLIPHHATGTDSAPGGLSLVGEAGPELINVPRGAQVISNSNLRNAQGVGSKSTTRVEIVDTTGLFETRVSSIAATGDAKVLSTSVAHTNRTAKALNKAAPGRLNSYQALGS